MKRKFLLLALMCIMVSAMKAQLTVPYSSVIGVPKSATETGTGILSPEWTTFDVDNDSVMWKYNYQALKFSGEAGTGACASIQSVQYKQSDDWLISPAIHLEKGKSYKIGLWTYATSNNLGYSLAMTQDVSATELADAQAANEAATYESLLLSKIQGVFFFANPTAKKNTLMHEINTVSPAETGDYRIGIHFGTSKPTGGTFFVTTFTVDEDSLIPGAITGLAYSNNGEDLNVNLSWTLPIIDDGGNALSVDDLTAVNIYRDGTLIATVAGNSTSYVDESLTEGGFHYYSVAAVATGEGASDTTEVFYAGPLPVQAIPYTTDLSDLNEGKWFWTIIDANADGRAWVYNTENGNHTYEFQNYDTTITEDDYLISPQMAFDQAGTYKLTWNGNSPKGHLVFLLSSGKTVDDMATATTISDLNVETYSGSFSQDFEFNVETAGNYYIAIHIDNNPSEGYYYYTRGISVEFVPEGEPEYVTITMPTEGYATFSSSKNLDFAKVSGLKAYIAEEKESQLIFTETSAIPAGTGVLLIGDAGEYSVNIATEAPEAIDNNLFVGVSMATVVPEGTYLLMNGLNGIGFYPTSEAKEIAEWKAYIPASASNLEFIPISFQTSAVELNSVELQENGVIYDLNGNKVTKPSKGLYIINHHVVLIK